MPTDTTESVPPRGDLRRRVLSGEPAIGLFLNLGSVVSAEVVARAGYDWALVDLEHGMATESEVLAQLVAIQSTPTAAIVRVVSAERMRVGRILDLGAEGGIQPVSEAGGAGGLRRSAGVVEAHASGRGDD